MKYMIVLAFLSMSNYTFGMEQIRRPHKSKSPIFNIIEIETQRPVTDIVPQLENIRADAVEKGVNFGFVVDSRRNIIILVECAQLWRERIQRIVDFHDNIATRT